MLKNHIKIAFRSLIKNLPQTTINLVGLTLGMVSSLCILVYVFAQFGYDEDFDRSASIYRINSKIQSRGNSTINSKSCTASPPIAFAIKEDYPEVQQACRLVYFGEGYDQLLKREGSNNSFYETRGYLADSTFFEIFNYPFLEGTPKTALKEPNTIVITSALAEKLFGNEKALNKTILIGEGNSQIRALVNGVIDEKAFKTHLNPNYLLTMNSSGTGKWVNTINNFATQNFAHSYLKLKKNVNQAALQAKFPDFLNRRAKKDLAQAGFDKTLLLQPIQDIHLYSVGIGNQIDEISSINYLYTMLLLAAVIILVASINFINLSTARANKRAKEIGVRKVVGANKNSLTNQFLGESIVLTLIAVLVSIPISMVFLPLMNVLLNSDLTIDNLLNIKVLSVIAVVGIITGILAGIYPALILSAIKPVQILKGDKLNLGYGNLRKGLVVFQFVISTVLIISVLVITKQLKYAQNKEMGFDKENLIAVRLGTNELKKNHKVLKEKMQAVTGIVNVSGSGRYPSSEIGADLGMHLPNEDPTNLKKVFYNFISENYFETVGTKLLKGRALSKTDSSQAIVNKATLDLFNIPVDEAIGKIISQTYEGKRQDFEIVGVSENYHFASIKEDVKPIILFHNKSPNYMILRTETTDFKPLLSSLKTAWKSVSDVPFDYTFIDENVKKMYEEEQKTSQLSIVFSVMAIVISCLGLFGLVSYVVEQKKKEIGIRKVLGATVQSVVNLITKDFLKLVGLAIIIASPVAYFLMKNWLEDYAYRINIDWWIFALAGGIAIIITLFTVGFQSVNAALANPTKSLKSE